MRDKIDQLERLAALVEQGHLTRAEFDQQKAAVLGTDVAGQDPGSPAASPAAVPPAEAKPAGEAAPPAVGSGGLAPAPGADTAQRTGLFVGAALLVALLLGAVVSLSTEEGSEAPSPAAAPQERPGLPQSPEAAVEAWNRALDEMDASAYGDLLGERVRYYRDTLSREDAVARKRRSLGTVTTFSQTVVPPVAFERVGSRAARARFVKKGWADGTPFEADALLELRRDDDGWRVVAESDWPTEQRLTQERRTLLRTQRVVDEIRLDIDGDGAREHLVKISHGESEGQDEQGGGNRMWDATLLVFDGELSHALNWGGYAGGDGVRAFGAAAADGRQLVLRGESPWNGTCYQMGLNIWMLSGFESLESTALCGVGETREPFRVRGRVIERLNQAEDTHEPTGLTLDNIVDR